MADVQVLYNEVVAATTAATTAWVDLASISAGSFTAGAKYLILANQVCKHDNSTNETRVRLVHGTTPTAFDDASLAYEGTATTQEHELSYMFMYTQPGTPELVKLQISCSSTSTVTNILSQIIAINMDDVGTDGTDYYWDEDLVDYTMTTTETSKAQTASFTPNGTDRWLYIGHMIWDAVVINAEIEFTLHDSVLGVVNRVREEAEDATNDFLSANLYWSGVPSNAARTVSVQPVEEAGSNIMLASRVIAINLSKFAQSASAHDATEVDPASSPTYTTVATVAPTPSATGNWVVIGYLVQDVNEATTDFETRMQVNASGGGLADDPPYPSTPPGIDQWDPTDEIAFSVFNLVSLSSGASRTINWDVRQVAGTTGRVEDCGLVAFSVAKPGGTQYEQSAGGTLTSSGALIKDPRKLAAGTLTSAGTLTRSASKNAGGTLAPAGTTIKDIFKIAAGTLSLAGALETARLFVMSLSGTLTSAGTIQKDTAKNQAGTLTSAGELLKTTSKAFTGALTSSGALTTIKTFVLSLSGTLTSSGALVRDTYKSLAGTLSPAGALSKLVSKLFSGTLTSSGALAKETQKPLTGTLTSSGTITRLTAKVLSGTLTPAGTVTKSISKILAGALSLSGAVTRLFSGAAELLFGKTKVEFETRHNLEFETKHGAEFETRHGTTFEDKHGTEFESRKNVEFD